MRVALVGPSYSGKSTLFAAVAEAGGTTVHLDRPDQGHLAVLKVPDERVEWGQREFGSKKAIHAELELLDVPGLDLSDQAGRGRARAHWPAVRNSDMIVLVLRAFADEAVPAYRGRVDPRADLDELMSEMLFSDLEQVTNRVAKLTESVRKPTPDRDEQLKELALMQRLQQALEQEKPLTEAVENEAEEKMVRAFAFLTLKPTLVVINCDEDAAAEPAPGRFGAYPAIQLSARIEEEIARLDPSERAEFLADLGITSSASERLIRSCYEAMHLVSFLTFGDREARAWTVPAGTDALTAAGGIHTDMARGFIRAEVVSFADLRAAGSEKAARAAGKYRLEGKTYVVQDGDVIYFRFNV